MKTNICYLVRLSAVSSSYKTTLKGGLSFLIFKDVGA